MQSNLINSNQSESNTGWPKSKFEICFGYNSKIMNFWPYVGKAKMGLKGGGFFWKCKQIAENCKQTAEK